MTRVVVDDVTVRYGEVVALRDTSLTVEPGRVTGVIGMNGSGKTTLLKVVTGIVRPTSGHVLLDGGPPGSAHRLGLVAYVPQSHQVDWDFPVSVRDVVMMGRYGHLGALRRPRRQDDEAVEQALDRVDLADLASRQIGRLSGGQRKRAFLARGLAQQARVLLLDEPFAGVDKASEATIVAVLRGLAREGLTVLVSTHDLHGMPLLADEAILLRGTALFQGSVSDALLPRNLYRAFGVDPTADGGVA